jgi:hypothetical protein
MATVPTGWFCTLLCSRRNRHKRQETKHTDTDTDTKQGHNTDTHHHGLEVLDDGDRVDGLVPHLALRQVTQVQAQTQTQTQTQDTKTQDKRQRCEAHHHGLKVLDDGDRVDGLVLHLALHQVPFKTLRAKERKR